MGTRWGDIITQPISATITGVGTAVGPGGTTGGDAWQLVTKLSTSDMPAGARRYGLIVTGTVHNQFNAGSGGTPQHALVQVCLGRAGGFKASNHCHQFRFADTAGPLTGHPFFFMVAQDSSGFNPDPDFGNTITPTTNDELCIWARVYMNGDILTTQQLSFSVTDVTWFWWDLSSVPGGDQLVETYYPAGGSALPTTSTNLWTSTNQPGTAGEDWLHFHQVVYRPIRTLLSQQPAPSFQFGTVALAIPSTFTPRIGTNERFGLSRNSTQMSGFPLQVNTHQGAWWYGPNPGTSFRVAAYGRDRVNAGVDATRWSAVRYLGIRLESLYDVLGRTETEVLALTGNRYGGPTEGTEYLGLERPATGLVSAPAVMATGIVQTTGSHDYNCELYTNIGTALSTSIVHAHSRNNQSEGLCAMAFARYGLAASSGAVQYRARWTGGLLASNSRRDVRDIYVLQLNLVQNPQPDPTLPATPTYLTLSPGRESANPASLNALPTAPDAEVGEDATVTTERISGATGYERTWPLFGRVRRQFALQWSNLSGSTGQTLLDFLRANPAFRWRPHRGSADIAVVQLDEPTLEQVSGHVYTVSARVAELIWTL